MRNYQDLFQSISGPKAMDWNFQSVKYLDNLVQNYGGRKARVEKQNSKKGFEKNEHACIVLGIFVVSDLSACQYLKVPCPIRKIQSSSKL